MLGSVTTNEGSKQEILLRIARTVGALSKLKDIAFSSKIRKMRSLVISILLYASDTWFLTAELERKIQATEMGCFRKLLGITYRDHVTNEAVGNITTMRKRKLKWHGHVTRSTGLEKMILQGAVQGGRCKGRQKKRWEDNIRN